MARCSKCRQDLPSESFHACKTAKNGLQSYCKACTRERQQARNKGRKPALKLELGENGYREHKKALNKAWREKNKKHQAEKMRKWRIENPDAYREHRQRSRRKRIKHVIALNQQRLKHIKQATPPWAEKKVITDLYVLAKVMSQHSGIQFDVDHIVPLRGVTVCGLHVQDNLRLLPRRENQLKHNYFNEVAP